MPDLHILHAAAQTHKLDAQLTSRGSMRTSGGPTVLNAHALADSTRINLLLLLSLLRHLQYKELATRLRMQMKM